MTARGWLRRRVPKGRRRTRSLVVAGAITALVSVALAGGAGASSMTAHALGAGDVYSMSIPGITGTGATGGPGDIAIQSWSFGTSRSATISPDGRQFRPGHAKAGTIIITRKIDAASPSLYGAITTGKFFPTVTLYVTPPASAPGAFGGDSATIVFSDVVVTGENWSGVADRIPRRR